MKADDLRDRTKHFSLRIIKLVAALPRNREGDVLGRQLLRSGTSVGANYREALRASSRKQFVYSVDVALREADESAYWLELLTESALVPPQRLSLLSSECQELVAILAATVRTAKGNLQREKSANVKPTPTSSPDKSEIQKSEIP